jgi:hypothetical protein
MAQSGVGTQHRCDSAQGSVGFFLGAKHRVNAVDVAENLSCVGDLGARQRHRHPNLIAFDVVRIGVEFGELPLSLPAGP